MLPTTQEALSSFEPLSLLDSLNHLDAVQKYLSRIVEEGLCRASGDISEADDQLERSALEIIHLLKSMQAAIPHLITLSQPALTVNAGNPTAEVRSVSARQKPGPRYSFVSQNIERAQASEHPTTTIR